MVTQLITPNPDIPCQPGWCLKYVHEAFGQTLAVYPTATASWEASTTKHPDMSFPDGMWVPVWFSLDSEPAGHVALRAPDGSVYSTSDYATTAHHHPSLDDLIQYYAKYGLSLVYLGWTEDVEGTPVISIGGSRMATLDGDDLNTIHGFTDQVIDAMWQSMAATQKMVQQVAAAVNAIQPGSVDLAAIAKAVADEEAKRLAGK